MRFSLRSGGLASSVIGQPLLVLPSLALLDMSSGLQSFWRNGKNASEWQSAQDAVVDDQQCWNALEETAVIMLCLP